MCAHSLSNAHLRTVYNKADIEVSLSVSISLMRWHSYRVLHRGWCFTGAGQIVQYCHVRCITMEIRNACSLCTHITTAMQDTRAHYQCRAVASLLHHFLHFRHHSSALCGSMLANLHANVAKPCNAETAAQSKACLTSRSHLLTAPRGLPTMGKTFLCNEIVLPNCALTPVYQGQREFAAYAKSSCFLERVVYMCVSLPHDIGWQP